MKERKYMKKKKNTINKPRTIQEYKVFLKHAQPIIDDDLLDLIYINSDGTLIRNVDLSRWLNPYLDSNKRPKIELRLETGGFKEFSVCRLVAECYVPNPFNKPLVHHIDGNPTNNDYRNLIWVTASEHRQLHLLMDLFLKKPYENAIKHLKENITDALSKSEKNNN